MTEESEADKSAEIAPGDSPETTEPDGDGDGSEADPTEADDSGADRPGSEATEPDGDGGEAPEPEVADAEATDADTTGLQGGEGSEAIWLLDLDGGEAAGSPGDEGDLGDEGDDEGEGPAEDPGAGEAVDEEVAVATPSIDAPLSSAGRRLGGLVLDTLLFVVTAGIGWMVWSLRVWARGQTPAKSLLSMRVVKLETGRAAKWSTMALREGFGAGLLTVITAGITALVSCFLILGESRQGVWDRIAGTVVVDDKDNRLLR